LTVDFDYSHIVICINLFVKHFLQVPQLVAMPGSIRLSDTVVNSSRLAELAQRLNITVDEFSQLMNISLNTSKVLELAVYYRLLC